MAGTDRPSSKRVSPMRRQERWGGWPVFRTLLPLTPHFGASTIKRTLDVQQGVHKGKEINPKPREKCVMDTVNLETEQNVAQATSKIAKAKGRAPSKSTNAQGRKNVYSNTTKDLDPKRDRKIRAGDGMFKTWGTRYCGPAGALTVDVLVCFATRGSEEDSWDSRIFVQTLAALGRSMPLESSPRVKKGGNMLKRDRRR